jgi:putative endonuclease
MAAVYILYSAYSDKFYVGSCKEITERLDQHLFEYFPGAFTAKAKDWIIYFYIDNLAYSQARKIELHIKRMRSRRYIENIKKYPELLAKLVTLYQER